MPINTNVPLPTTRKPSVYDPDYVPSGLEHHAATMMMDNTASTAQSFPENWDQMTPEDQQKWKDRHRFLGTRLRGDIKGQSVAITRETLDVP